MTDAIIFDLDNTILYQTNRNPFNWSDLSGDVLIPEIESLISVLYNAGNAIMFVTGRPELARVQTEKWLEDNGVDYDRLYMKQGDPMGKAVHSKELTLNEIKKEFNVVMAFEDDNKCAEMYVKNNVMTLMPLNYKISKRNNQSTIPF